MLDSQTIERLILDDALGRLEPDVSALLKAYLVAHPQQQADAQTYAELASSAQRAVEVTEPLVLPRFPRETSAPIPLTLAHVQAFAWRRWAAAAACLVLGLVLGHVLTRPAARIVAPEPPMAPPTLRSPEYPPAEPALAAVRVSPTMNSEAFWSMRRLLKNSDENKRVVIPVQWSSPVVSPRLKKGDS